MTGLPSIYSDEGLNQADSKKFITTRKEKMSNGESMEFKIKQLIHDLKAQLQTEQDGDVMMIGSDDVKEVEVITNLVSTQRRQKQRVKEIDQPISIPDEKQLTPLPPSQKLIFLIIDTNFILSHLDILDELLKSYNYYKQSYQLIIPRTTMQELDGLKNSKQQQTSSDILSNKSIAQLARWANDWCYNNLAASNPLIRGQKSHERLDSTAVKDDSILDCCLYMQMKFPSHLVILLSNDKNFCMKLLANGVLTISYRPRMNAKLIARTIIQENLSRGNGKVNNVVDENLNDKMEYDVMEIEYPENYHHQQEHQLLQQQQQQNNSETSFADQAHHLEARPQQQQLEHYLIKIADVNTGLKVIYQEVQTLIISLVDKIMIKDYGEDLELISYKRASNFSDILEILIQYWIPVFHDYITIVNVKSQFEKNKRGRLGLCKFPETLDQLEVFLNFWGQILSDLYRDKPHKDKQALVIFYQRWNNIIEQITQLSRN